MIWSPSLEISAYQQEKGSNTHPHSQPLLYAAYVVTPPLSILLPKWRSQPQTQIEPQVPNSFGEKAANPNPIKQPSVSIFIPHKAGTSGLINSVRMSLVRGKRKGIDRFGERTQH